MKAPKILRSKVFLYVAPVVSVGFYLAVDHKLAEKPQPAAPGQHYELSASSNCRYPSGACTLENGDIVLRLQPRRLDAELVELSLSTSVPAEGVLLQYVAGGGPDKASSPSPMLHQATPESWKLQLAIPAPDRGLLRVVAQIQGSTYYAETTGLFVDRETSFSQENMAAAAPSAAGSR